MNKRAFRLIFDRRRGMRVATSELARGAGKAAGGGTRSGATVLGAVAALLLPLHGGAQQQRPPVVFASKAPVPATGPRLGLPQPYGATTGRTDRSFVADPRLAPRVSWTPTASGTSAVFDQGTVERVVLNWDSFDIGAGNSVYFKQDKDPNKYVSALNKIWSNDPSVILGSLKADREVILLNANGVYFGRGAVVDTAKFVATTLNLADEVFERGLRNVRDGSAVFTATDGADGYKANFDSAVTVEAGATIRTLAGGDVLLVAPRVVNQGRIDTAGGQTVLAAGGKVFLMSSSDPAQRGLIVAVDPIKVLVTRTDPDTGATATEEVIDPGLGIVENAAAGSFKTVNDQIVPDSTPDTTAGLATQINELRADAGSINLVGLLVRQNGNAHATTAVKGANGAIYLQAQQTTTTLDQSSAAARGYVIEDGASVTVSNQLGSVVLGSASSTSVRPSDDDTRTQLDAEVFNRSRIRVEGQAIHLEAGASLSAPSGNIELLAARQAQASTLFNANASAQTAGDGSRIVVDAGVSIDAAGLRDVALDGTRNQGELRLFRIELADAPVQRTGPLYRSVVQFDLRDADGVTAGNVTGAANIIGRSARERSTTGGSVRLESEGAVVVGDNTRIDISGGSVRYAETALQTSLLSRGGRVVTFGAADGTLRYDELLAATRNSTVPAYSEGKDGGSLSVVGRQGYFGGSLKADVVEGAYQRGSSDRAAPASASFGRQVGVEQALQTIQLAAAAGQAPAADFFADALDTPLTALPSAFDLSLPMLQDSGLGRLTLRANEVVQTGGTGLDLGVGGALDMAARAILLDGAFVAPGGRIVLRTNNVLLGADAALGNITLAPGTVLSTAGLWTNDAADATAAAAAGSSAPPARVQVQGGSIELSAARSVIAGAGSEIDVSAGAWQAAGRKPTLGTAGQLTLTAGTGLADATLLLGGSIAGLDYSAGGSLTLGVPQLTVGAAGGSGFSLTPEFFSGNGFGSIAVRSLGDVVLTGGTLLQPQLRNWVLDPGSALRPSAAMGAGVASPQFLDEALVDRKPVNLALSATGQIGTTADVRGASILVERGAGIVLEEGGKLTLEAARDVAIGVTGASSSQRTVLQALGGEITLRTTGSRGASSTETAGEDAIGFVPEQALWLGDSATLSVAGTAELRTQRASRLDAAGPTFSTGAAGDLLNVGKVYGGGTLTLEAARGYVVAEAGSQIHLDGAAADVNLAGLAAAVRVAKSAGNLNVASPEGFVLDGTVSARAPTDAQGRATADGGRLKLEVGPGGVSTIESNLDPGRDYPANATNRRTITVGEQDGMLAGGSAAVQYGDNLTTALGNGRGVASLRLLDRSGFDALTLRAGDEVAFSGPVSLNKALRIEIDAPAIVGAPGADVQLRATQVVIGNPTFSRVGDALPADTAAAADASPDRSTRLRVQAEVIDVLGDSGLKGFSTVALHADQVPGGEIRLTGNLGTSPTRGSLAFAGTLDLVAGQAYATSYTRFDLLGLDAAGGATEPSRLLIGATAAGRSLAPPLSAFGDLRLTATDIVQGGVLRQPFGAITLNASGTLTLPAGSETSVSGFGVVVPFGTTTNLSQWFASGVAGELTAPLIEKRVVLNAGQLVSDPAAVVSARGGGDLQAAEFFPGVGGSKDYFETAGLYAVLPGYQSGFSPRSEETSSSASSLAGTQIEITMAGSGLAPGRYTLLPARYALLADSRAQGAFIVKLAADQGSAVLGRPIQQDDGSTVVTGYMTQAGASAMGQPGQRFVVESPAVFRGKSEIRLSRMSEFFENRAATLGTVAGSVPRDAGAARFDIADALNGSGALLQAAIDLQAEPGARAGTLDIAAPRIALVTQAADAPADHLAVAATTLQAAQAGSVLLGGIRSTAATGPSGLPAASVDTARTREVLVATTPGQPVQLQELLLAAGERVTVADGAALAASASGSLGARELRLSGDGAFAAVSANAGLSVERSNAALLTGELRTGAASQLSGAEVQLDATGALTLDSSTELLARSFVLGARRVAIGGASGAAGATVFEGRLLDSVLAADALQLRSYSSIDFVGRQDIAQRAPTSGSATKVLETLTLDAPTVRGVDRLAADGSVLEAAATDIAARNVVLRNTAQTVDAATGVAAAALPEAGLPGAGSLRIESLPPLQFGSTGGIYIGPGVQRLGFADATLATSGDIVVQGSGALGGQGDLTLESARVTATSNAVQSITAAGTLALTAAPQGRTLNERVGQGGQLRLAGATIVQGGTIDLPSGSIALDATGTTADAAAITLQPNSITRAAGFSIAAQDGWQVHGDGGQVSARAAIGRIDLFGTVDVAAARDTLGNAQAGSAGSIALSASGSGGRVDFEQRTVAADGSISTANGVLLGSRGTAAGDRGGQFALDVRSQDVDAAGVSTLAGAAALVRAGGFDRAVDVRVRAGDLRIDGAINAERIGVTTDLGALEVGAVTLNADAAQGGVVQLQAQQSLTLRDGSVVQARSARIGANGGDVLLASTEGRVQVAAGAVVDATGNDAQDGRIVLRAPRGADAASVNVDPLNPSNLRAAEVDIEAVRVYSTVTASGLTRDISAIAAGNSVIAGSGSNRTGTLGQASVRADSAAFMASRDTVLTALGVDGADRDRIHLRAGVEVQASGNLTIASDWALNGDRPGGDAGFLTLRAAGNLLVNNSVSDGFTSALASGALNGNTRSWSYRFSAGADLGSADLLATRDLSGGSTETGNLSIAAAKLVRTGAGSIELAAGRDIVFSGTATPGQVYVAGRQAADQAAVLASLFAEQEVKPIITEQGGRLALEARRDIRAPAPSQLINNWFWRSGLLNPLDATNYADFTVPAWWTQFSRFQQTAGSFGGGNIQVDAGRDITNLSLMAPSTAWVDSRVVAQADLVVRNGGDIDVAAGGNVTDGQYFLGRGQGHLRAGGAVSSSAPSSGRLIALAAIDAGWDIAARGDVRIGTVFNPTAAPPPTTDDRANTTGYFFSYGDGSALDITSLGGDVTFAGITASSITGTYRLTSTPNVQRLFQVLPENVRVSALGGDIVTASGNAVLLAPSARGQLALYAGGNINLNATIGMVDSAEDFLPDLANPAQQADLRLVTDAVAAVSGVLRIGASGSRSIADSQPHGSLRAEDAEPVRVAAGGSINASGSGVLNLAKPALITAGADIDSLTLLGQHHGADDLTVVQAGRNLLHSLSGGYALAGPGQLQLVAGRQLDLGASLGITTTGNVSNATLPTGGASVKAVAGAAGRVNVDRFVAAYLEAAGGSAGWQAHRDTLLAYVRTELNDNSLAYDRALLLFRDFPASAQAALARRIQNREFGERYLAAAPPSEADYTAQLNASFAVYKATLLAAGRAALDAQQSLTLPGNEVLTGDGLRAYLAALAALSFSDVDVSAAVTQRASALATYSTGWKAAVAASQGSTASELEALRTTDPGNARYQRYQQALQTYSGTVFESYRDKVVQSEVTSAGAASSGFGLKTLPLRLAFYDQGFNALELAGLGNFEPTAYWTAAPAALAYTGTLNMTQSSVVTRRGGDITLLNPGGAINVGLKDASGARNAASGVVALGGGDVFGVAKDDFQVNNQRVFVVGTGDMTLWSSRGDIDSGRGQNTAVGTPPLTARRSVDGVVFEVPPTTTGSGLGILADVNGVSAGTIGLYPAFGEILALDAFIRAPSVVLGSTIRGADNLQAASVGGAAAPVAVPPPAVTPPAPNADNKGTAPTTTGQDPEARQRNSLLTVELLGLGTPAADELCTDEDERDKKCRKPAPKCSDEQKAGGLCK